MKKILQDRLIAQAEEAKELGMAKLAEAISNSLDDTTDICQEKQLDKIAYDNLWKIALATADYYDLKNIDTQKIDALLNSFIPTIKEELKQSLNVKDIVGPKEPKLIGEK